MNRQYRTAMLLASFLLLGSSSLAAQLVTSTFAGTNEGWTVNGFAYSGHLGGIGAGVAASFDATEGQPAGSVRVGDAFGETCFQAPAAFLGDKSAYYGGTLSFDILIRTTDATAYPATMLVGAAKTLFYVMPSPPVGAWLSRSVPLTETGWKVNGWTGPPATQVDLQTVLGALQKLLINSEWHTGSDDTNLDNVVLQPAAGSAWMNLGSGLAGITGVPVLVGSGPLASGSAGSLSLVNARPSSPTVLFLSLSSVPLPVKGGVLLAHPDVLTLNLGTSATGAILLPWSWPAGIPSGTSLYFQYGIKDAAAVQGVALSNAVKGVTS